MFWMKNLHYLELCCSSAGTCAVVTQWKRLGELHLVDTPTQCVFVCVQKVGVLGEMSVCLGLKVYLI